MNTRIFKLIPAIIALLFFAAANATAQGERTMYIVAKNGTVNKIAVSDIDNIAFTYSLPDAVEINGVRWATRNVGEPGKFVDNPEEVGMFYQWNRTKGWPATGDITGWNIDDPTVETWETHNVCPAGYRVPTKTEIDNLIAPGSEWDNDKKGRVFGSGDNTIFLPVAGYRRSALDSNGVVSDGNSGYYWSSSTLDKDNAYYLLLKDDNTVSSNKTDGNYNRGYFVRCVVDAGSDIPVTGISLDAATYTLATGENFMLTATVTPANATNKTVTWESSNPAIVTVGNNGELTGIATGTTTITAQVGDKTATCTVTVINNKEDNCVMINDVCWTTRNIAAPGTFANTPEASGMFYQWNRNIGWSAANPMKDSEGGTTWNKSMPDGTTWESVDNICPDGYRMPTEAEIQRLLDSAGSGEWTTLNEVNGRKFGSGDNTIFLPATGYRYETDGSLGFTGSLGFYWGSTPDGLFINSDDASTGIKTGILNSGQSVRCVKDIKIPATRIILDKTEYMIAIGEDFTLTATVTPEYTTDIVKWESSSKSIATVDENGKVIGVAAGKATITATNDSISTICTVTVVHNEKDDCVEINGVHWTTRNVAAPGYFVSRPEDAGMFYQWNRNIGWSATDPMINSNGGTTWDNSMPTGTTWETTNNVCPAGYRVPTEAEIQRLIDSGSQWTTQNGVNGRLFGSGKNTLFLPAPGYRDKDENGALTRVGLISYYWASTQYESIGAYRLQIRAFDANNDVHTRLNGFSVRCVAE